MVVITTSIILKVIWCECARRRRRRHAARALPQGYFRSAALEIVSLMPAPPSAYVAFMTSDGTEVERKRPVAYAMVSQPYDLSLDPTEPTAKQRIEPLISISGCHKERADWCHEDGPDKNIYLASEYARQRLAFNSSLRDDDYNCDGQWAIEHDDFAGKILTHEDVMREREIWET